MKIFLTIALMISFTVAANLLMKTGATSQDVSQDFVARMLSWQVILGLTCFGIAALIYVLVLSWLPLNVAQSFAAAQFIAVIVAARLLLAEPIATPQWVGIMLIAAGIGVVGMSR